MRYIGPLKKMLTELKQPVQYYLDLESDFIHVNQIIGSNLEINHVSNKCKSCGLDKPIFRMGFCKNCFFTVPEANPNILRPELSKAHLGEENRDLEWEKEFELQPHIVYLAQSGGVKVGVTREVQIPFRWIDQGADQAIILAKTENRYEAGVIEVALKDHYADKTNWRKMLTSKSEDYDLMKEKHKAIEFVPQELLHYVVEKDDLISIEYPIDHYFSKVKSVKLNRNEAFKAKLVGIKGQYLIFEDQQVLNVRANEGKVVEITL